MRDPAARRALIQTMLSTPPTRRQEGAVVLPVGQPASVRASPKHRGADAAVDVALLAEDPGDPATGTVPRSYQRAGRGHADHRIGVTAEPGVAQHGRAAHRPAEHGHALVAVRAHPFDARGDVVDLLGADRTAPAAASMAPEVDRQHTGAFARERTADRLHVRAAGRSGEPVCDDAAEVAQARIPVQRCEVNPVRSRQLDVLRQQHARYCS